METEGLPTLTSSALTPTGYSAIQLNSNTLRGDSISSHRLKAQSHKATHHPLHFRCQITSLGCHLCFWPTGYESVVPKAPLLGFNHFASTAHKTQGALVILLDHWLTIKGYNTATASWKGCIGQNMGERCQLWSLHALSRHTTLLAPWSVHQSRSFLNLFINGF